MDILLSPLHAILCAVFQLAGRLIDFLVLIANVLVLTIGTVIAALLSLLPTMPDPPEAPGGGVVGLLNWVFPVGPLVATCAGLTALWLAFLVIRIGLRWVKAL